MILLLLCASATPIQAATGTESFLRGLDLLEAGKFKEAAVEFTAAIETDDENADYRIALGVALTLGEQLPEAEKALTRALKLSNRSDEARLWMATAVAMQGQFMRDTEYFPAAVSRDEYVNEIRRMSREYGQAAFAVDNAKRNGNNEWDVAYAQQEMAKRDGLRKKFPQLGSAFSERMKAKIPVAPRNVARDAKSPELGAALLERIESNINKDDFAAAMRDIRPLLRSNGSDPQLIICHAICQLNLGAPEIARRQLTRALYTQPLDGDLYAMRAVAAARTGDTARATKDLAAAAALGAKRLPWAETETNATVKPSGQPAQMLDAMLESARSGASYAKLVDAAMDVCRAQNATRLRLDEDFIDQLRGHERAIAADGNDAAKLAAFAAFLYDNASSPRGEAVEVRATWRPYRPVTDAMLEAEITRSLSLAERALSIDARNVSALITKAAVLSKRMQLSEAERFLKSALELAPTEPRLLRLFAEVADRAAAAKAAQASSLRSPTTWEDHIYIYTRYPSSAELAQADQLEAQANRLWELARNALNQAISSATDAAEKSFMQAVLNRRDGRIEAALASARSAVELKPTSLEYLDLLTALFAQTGQRAEALLNQSRTTNLVHSTAGPALKCVWLSLPRTKFKTSREYLATAAQCDAADPRVAAYYGAVAGADERDDLAAAWYSVACALYEASTRLEGVSASSKEPSPLRIDVAVSMMNVNLRAARLMRTSRPDDADVLLRANLAMQDRIIPAELFQPIASAMLPDVDAEQIPLPRPDHAGLLLSASRLELGHVLLAAKKYDEAMAEYEAVGAYRKMVPPTVDAGSEMQRPINAAAVYAVSTLIAKGDMQAAADRFRYVPRPNSMDAETRAEYSRIAELVNQYRSDGRAREDEQVQQQIRQQQEDAMRERQRQIDEINRRRKNSRPG